MLKPTAFLRSTCNSAEHNINDYHLFFSNFWVFPKPEPENRIETPTPQTPALKLQTHIMNPKTKDRAIVIPTAAIS